MATSAQHGDKVIPALPGAFEIVHGQPYLVGTKCSKCGRAFFPPRYICTYCLTDESVQKVRLGNIGRLYSYTVIHVSSKEFNPPYVFGYVILEPENIRIPTPITGVRNAANPEELETGMKMEMVIEKLLDDDRGNVVITYKFRPAVETE